MLRYVTTLSPSHLRLYRLNLVLMLTRSQNDYAAILAKRVNEEKAKKSELRSKYIPWHLQQPKALHTTISVFSPSLN